MSYSDVLSMPVHERRFFLGLLTRDVQQREEHIEKIKEKQQTSNSKGNRQTKVSGAQLKNRIKSGDIPLT
jgi:hypothetical protein